MSSAQTPALGVLAMPNPPPAFAWVLLELSPWATPRAVDPDIAPDAFIAASPRTPGIAAALSTGKPMAVWVDDDVATSLDLGAAVLLTGDTRYASDDRFLFVPSPAAVDVDAIPPVPPFVRARLRRRERLPDRMVVDLRTDAMPRDLLPPALALCSACIATGDDVALALAWATPTVTDAASAHRWGARAGIDVAAGRDQELTGLALNLAADERLAAALSRSGRRAIETVGSRRHIGPTVAALLGLRGHEQTRPLARIDATLDAMNTPDAAIIRHRVRVALRPFAGAAVGRTA